MKTRPYFKYLITIIFLQTAISNAQTNFSNQEAIDFIKEYYSEFDRGYDFDGTYTLISNNYHPTFSDSIFTLTFDSYDENKNPQHQKITINLKTVTSIEPYGGDVVEVHTDDPFSIIINGNLGFFTENEVFEIPIYYQVDEDVTTSQIYKAFEVIWQNVQEN